MINTWKSTTELCPGCACKYAHKNLSWFFSPCSYGGQTFICLRFCCTRTNKTPWYFVAWCVLMNCVLTSSQIFPTRYEPRKFKVTVCFGLSPVSVETPDDPSERKEVNVTECHVCYWLVINTNITSAALFSVFWSVQRQKHVVRLKFPPDSWWLKLSDGSWRFFLLQCDCRVCNHQPDILIILLILLIFTPATKKLCMVH